MCWIGNLEKCKVAKEDLQVFKLVKINDNKIKSLFQGFKYERDRTYHTTFGIELLDWPLDVIKIHKGFHSYSKNCYLVFSEGVIHVFNKECILIYHITTLHENLTVLECLIPKGEQYFENNLGEIVSETIKVVKTWDLHDNPFLKKG